MERPGGEDVEWRDRISEKFAELALIDPAGFDQFVDVLCKKLSDSGRVKSNHD